MNDAVYMKDIPGFASDTSLFTSIQTIGGLFSGVSTSELQIIAEEYYMRSSQKRLSPICRKWENDAVDLTAFINKVSQACVTRYGRNWDRIYQAYFLENYKPLDNYNMKETKTPRVETTINVNTGTEIINDQESKVYGFNSTEPVNESENKVTTSGDKTKNESTSKTSYLGTDTLERSGNIGVTTSMQMLTQEIEGRKYDYWNGVFDDIDRLLCYILQTC